MWSALFLAAATSTPWVLAVGVNQPAARDLVPLHYADDDAVAATELYGTPARSVLLATLDAATQDLHPAAAARSVAPTHARLREAVQQVAQATRAERQQGEMPVVVVWLVGHGALLTNGGAALALEDGPLTPQELARDVLAPLSDAHRVHVVLDACHAGAMLNFRASVKAVDASVVGAAAFPSQVVVAPNVGFLLASSATQKTFEWDHMKGGVFSGLVRSALRGAADADGDGCVAYDETASYVASAMQGVPLPEARPAVTGRAPALDARAPLACGAWFENAWPLRGVARGNPRAI